MSLLFFLWNLEGDYTLCYRVTGAKDSVAQSGDGVKLQAGKTRYLMDDFS